MSINWGSYLAKVLDPYDLKARLFPGLLVIAPAIIFLGLSYGAKNPVLTALGSILATCGGPYTLANFVRTWGQRAQLRLYKKWGGQPTTIILRHGNTRLAAQTKANYHRLIEKKLGVAVPDALQELDDPALADQAYIAAADALRPLTNDKKKFPFVFKELVAYGFNRNAYGARWIGATISLLALLLILIRGKVLLKIQPFFDFSAINDMSLAMGVASVISVVLLFLWLFHFTAHTVEQAGYSYALRLFEALERISNSTAKRREKFSEAANNNSKS